MDRRQFLRRSLAAAGTAAVAGRVALPSPAQAVGRMGNVYAPTPFPYAIREVEQDATNTGGMALGNPVFAPQGERYRIRMLWEAMEIHVPTAFDALGGMTFRGADDQNFYYFVFFLDHVGISRIRNNVGAEVAKAPRPVDTTHPAAFTLVMHGNRFVVRDDAVPGRPVIIDWTDDLNVSPQGNHVDHWTRGGVKGCWEFAHGKPVGQPSDASPATSPARVTQSANGGPRDPRRRLGTGRS